MGSLSVCINLGRYACGEVMTDDDNPTQEGRVTISSNLIIRLEMNLNANFLGYKTGKKSKKGLKKGGVAKL